ncbi:hypothetical protein [Herbaspirillum huttiense]|uniref:hypothetical protein n=1 Tax=Herbaspirillum huttiense TaxID=863372 RepID=UPI002176977F|nr:hypothetical protein [Herbaspirillum huttiense]UWE17693.1 hypothetical protein NY669_05810 [Herbaspirillum huttiense]
MSVYNNYSDSGYAYALGVQRGRAERAESLVKNLEHRLKIAEENYMFREVSREATNMVFEAALAALRTKDPSSPLLDKNLREQMRRRFIADALATKGYEFDVTRGELAGKIR